MGDKRLIVAGKREASRGLVRYEDGGATVQQNWDAWRAEMERQANKSEEQWQVIDTKEKAK